MSEYLSKSVVYFEIFSSKVSKRLFRCIIKETPDFLLKSLTEAAFNLVESEIIPEQTRKELFKNKAFYRYLSKKGISLSRKKNYLLKHSKSHLLVGQLAKRVVVTSTGEVNILNQISEEYRDKAKVILEKVGPYLKLDPENNVIYWVEEGGSEVVGSNLVTLLKYFVGETKKVTLDRNKFAEIMKIAGVNISDLSTGISVLPEQEEEEEEDNPKWINVF